MPSTHTSLTVHAIFSTKERRPLIKNTWKSELFTYLGGVAKSENAIPLAVGGVEDHVHLLLALRPTHRLDYLLRDIKSDSSKWVRKDLRAVFKWQPGYAAFSVSPDRVDRVGRYIERQEEHHRRVSFKEEYLTLLDESGVPYDPAFLW